jgi:hypothetical protein
VAISHADIVICDGAGVLLNVFGETIPSVIIVASSS